MAKVLGHRAPFDRADSGSQRPKEEDKLDASLIWCCLVLTPTPLDPDCRLPLTLRDDLEPIDGLGIAASEGGSVKSWRLGQIYVGANTQGAQVGRTRCEAVHALVSASDGFFLGAP